MPRARYRNGDEIHLVHTGCDGCSPLVINGVLCHEPGCTEAYRDVKVECQECGSLFFAESHIASRFHRYCPDCTED